MRVLILTITITLSGLFATHSASAQLINLKTAPVATGDQFLVQPPVNIGMGNLSIALDDTLADPFINPAKTGKISGMHIYMLPTFYRISDGNGGARTLSVGGLTTGKEWFGGLGVAIQDMDQAPSGSTLLKDESTNNSYVWAQGGKWINKSTSLGGRLFWADLGALDGVDLLYPQSRRIDQSGYMLDLRVGLNGKTSARGNYEMLGLFHRTDMTHEVTYYFWGDPVFSIAIPPQRPRVEENMDKTNTWGLHLGYDRPVGEDDWTLGGIFTINYKTHPKIPNYELMNIPRDPGNTWSFNLGFGASHTSEDNVTFGTDLIVEPIRSNTWVEAEQNIYNQDKTELLVEEGNKTIENDFSFFNSTIKTGLGWKEDQVLLQAGILAKTYRYQLKQHDYVQESFRRQREHWTEWTFSLSVGMLFQSLNIKYTGLLTTGTGQPGTASTQQAARFSTLAADLIFAPDGELTLDNANVLTHQITVHIPI